MELAGSLNEAEGREKEGVIECRDGLHRCSYSEGIPLLPPFAHSMP